MNNTIKHKQHKKTLLTKNVNSTKKAIENASKNTVQNTALENNIHEKFTEFGANAKQWSRKCALLLPQIEKHQVWRKKGFNSIYEYAAKLAGMSHRTVDDALRIIRKIEDKPELMKVVEKKGINAIRPIVTLATKENAAFLAKNAQEMNIKTLRLYKKEISALTRNVENAKKAVTTVRWDANAEKSTNNKSNEKNKSWYSSNSNASIQSEAIWMELEKKDAEQLKKWKGDSDWTQLIKELIALKKEKLEKEKPLPVKTKSKAIPTAIQKYIFKRSTCQCEFPGCTKKSKELHHADRFALVHKHDPDRIFALCKEHHNLSHNGLIENEEKDIEFWKIRADTDRTDLKYLIDQRVLEHRNYRQNKSRDYKKAFH